MSESSFQWNEQEEKIVFTNLYGTKVTLENGSYFLAPKEEYSLCNVKKGSHLKYPRCGLESCAFCSPKGDYKLCQIQGIATSNGEPERLLYYIWNGEKWAGEKSGIFIKRFSFWLRSSLVKMLISVSPDELHLFKQTKEEVEAANNKAQEAFERGQSVARYAAMAEVIENKEGPSY